MPSPVMLHKRKRRTESLSRGSAARPGAPSEASWEDLTLESPRNELNRSESGLRGGCHRSECRLRAYESSNAARAIARAVSAATRWDEKASFPAHSEVQGFHELAARKGRLAVDKGRTGAMTMTIVGLDLGDPFSSACALGHESGEVQKGRLPTTRQGFARHFAGTPLMRIALEVAPTRPGRAGCSPPGAPGPRRQPTQGAPHRPQPSQTSSSAATTVSSRRSVSATPKLRRCDRSPASVPSLPSPTS